VVDTAVVNCNDILLTITKTITKSEGISFTVTKLKIKQKSELKLYNN